MENNNTNEAIITIAEIFRYIKNSILWIIGFVVVCGVVGFAYSDKTVEPKNSSSIEITVSPSAFGNSQGNYPGDYISGIRATPSIAEFLKSDAVLNATIKRLGIEDKYTASRIFVFP